MCHVSPRSRQLRRPARRCGRQVNECRTGVFQGQLRGFSAGLDLRQALEPLDYGAISESAMESLLLESFARPQADQFLDPANALVTSRAPGAALCATGPRPRYTTVVPCSAAQGNCGSRATTSPRPPIPAPSPRDRRACRADRSPAPPVPPPKAPSFAWTSLGDASRTPGVGSPPRRTYVKRSSAR